MRYRKLVSGFIACFIVLLSAACTNPIPPPKPNDAYVVTSGISSDGKALHIVLVGSVVDEDVNVSGLDIDLSCAESQTFNSTGDLRIYLLEAGCARIIGKPISSDEEGAQQDAKAAGIGEWSPSISAKIARAWAATLRWFVRDWPIISSVVGLVLGILGLSWVTEAMKKRRVQRLQRYIHVLIIGAASVGKSDLWNAWRSDITPKTGTKTTVGAHQLQGVPGVPYGEFTIHAVPIDTAGLESWLLMEQMRKVPAKSKIILVIVVAPCEDDEVGDKESAYDKEFIAEQKGYTSLPRAVLGERDSTRKPDRVVMFATKFDLISPLDPYDSQSETAKEKLEEAFRPHSDLIETICGERKIPFEMIIGSAKKGWGIQLLKDQLLRVIETGAE